MFLIENSKFKAESLGEIKIQRANFSN